MARNRLGRVGVLRSLIALVVETDPQVAEWGPWRWRGIPDGSTLGLPLHGPALTAVEEWNIGVMSPLATNLPNLLNVEESLKVVLAWNSRDPVHEILAYGMTLRLWEYRRSSPHVPFGYRQLLRTIRSLPWRLQNVDKTAMG